MKKIPLTQGKFALVDDEDFERISRFKWYALKNRRSWYACRITGRGDERRKYISMHGVVLGVRPGMVIDHINGDGLDNRRANLRHCTVGDNIRNRRTPLTNTTGYKGVVIRRGKHITAQINSNGCRRSLGIFPDLRSAALAYDAAARETYGEFANLNFPIEVQP